MHVHQDPDERSRRVRWRREAEVGLDDLGDVEGEDLGAVLVEVEAVVGADVLAAPSRGSTTYSAQPPLPLEKRVHVSTNCDGGAGRRGGAHGLVLDRQAGGDPGLSSLGMPTQTTVRPSAARRSITSPARRAYSGSHVVLGRHRVVPLPSGTNRRGSDEALGVVAAERHDDDVGSAVGSVAARCAGQSKKSGRARPDDTL